MKNNASDQHSDERPTRHQTVLDPHSLVSYRPFTTMLVWSLFSILPKCLVVIIICMHISLNKS